VTDAAAAAAVPAPAGPGARQPLDDIMLAMDVVDTIRRRERVLQRELDAEGREEDLAERLRKIYQAQGIDVPDHVIAEGVAALKEGRFVYTPPADGIGKEARAALRQPRPVGQVGARRPRGAGRGGAAYYFTVVAPTGEPAAADRGGATPRFLQVAATEDARLGGRQAPHGGQAALRDEDTGRAEAGPQPPSRTCAPGWSRSTGCGSSTGRASTAGSWRIPDVNAAARNYYVVVEAVDARGDVLTVPVEKRGD